MRLLDKLGRMPQGSAPSARSELRAKLQAAMGSAPTPTRRAPEVSFDELGLLERTTEQGSFWWRREALGATSRVGRSGCAQAVTASAEVLALLALDPTLACCDWSQALYLDTETTGLGGGAGTFAFLIGLAYLEQGGLVLEQLFLAGPEQEAAVLAWLAVRLEQSSAIVSFNGKAFDWPLLRGRFVMNHLPPPAVRPHLDLLHVARRVHGRRLRRCTLKNVEDRVLGFERDGDVDGAEVSARYGHYLRSGDPTGLLAVLRHNAWDVATMTALVALYGEVVPDLHALDLAELAGTYRRARAYDQASVAADAAVERGGGSAALCARAEVSKAKGERLRALLDYESAAATVDDPAVRLELAKLYEHTVKAPERALLAIARGTTESPDEHEKRRARLRSKLQRTPRSK